MPLKTYTVIPHSCPSGLALRQQSKMEEPKGSDFYYGIRSVAYKREHELYEQHIASREIIEIAIEYKEHWKIRDEVPEREFKSITRCIDKYAAQSDLMCCHHKENELCKYCETVAIPKAKEEQEKEKGLLDEIIEWTQWLGEMGWYMEKSGRWVHDDETGYFATTKDLVEHYLGTKKNKVV